MPALPPLARAARLLAAALALTAAAACGSSSDTAGRLPPPRRRAPRRAGLRRGQGGGQGADRQLVHVRRRRPAQRLRQRLRQGPRWPSTGVTLNQVRINDTAEAVNKVLGEKQAGKDDGGTRRPDLDQRRELHDRSSRPTPSLRLRRRAAQRASSSTSTTPASPPTSACRPRAARCRGAGAQRARLRQRRRSASTTSRSLDALFELGEGHTRAASPTRRRRTSPARWPCAPSSSTRPAAPTTSSARSTRPTYDAVAPQLWKRLNDLEPALYRAGETYPAGRPEVEKLFAGGEIDAYLTYGSSAVGAAVEKGTLPRRPRAARSSTAGNIGNYSFTAIPDNAAAQGGRDGARRPAAVARGAALENAGPDGAGFTSAIDLGQVPAEQARAVRRSSQSVAVPGAAAELADATLPEVVERAT